MSLWLLLLVGAALILTLYFIFGRKTPPKQDFEAKKCAPQQIQPTETIEPSPVITKVLESAAKAAPTPPRNIWQTGMQKSRQSLFLQLQEAFQTLGGGSPWRPDHPLWDRLEESLLAADLGPKLSEDLLQSLRGKLSQEPSQQEILEALRARMLELFATIPARQAASAIAKPQVVLLIGVNGAGKTTTAAKLAYLALEQKQKVLLGAADTFRAAAVEQLQTWADRLGVECIKPAQGANPAAVAFDAVAAAVAQDADMVIIDTAGRLHTKENLMEELKKLARVIAKKIPGAPHSVYLVLDASLGQNALQQAREFHAAIAATGLILTKMDGSAKGGAALAVATELGIPIAYIGLGEANTDLRAFDAAEFVERLLEV